MTQNLIKGGLVIFSAVVAIGIFFKIEMVRMGGPVMIPILLASLFAFALVFDKCMQFARESGDTDALLKSIFESIERQRIKEALDLCDQVNTGAARVLKAGIMKYDRSKEEIREAMQDLFLYEAPGLESKLPILATIVQTAPLLGFLGTMVGLISIFKGLESAGHSLVPVAGASLSHGVWQALICSAAGFLIAIPGLIAYNYLVNRVKLLVEEMERASTQLLGFLVDRRMP